MSARSLGLARENQLKLLRLCRHIYWEVLDGACSLFLVSV